MPNERFVNKNFTALHQAISDPTKVGILLEGSSRSGKTISAVDFIIYLCIRVETNATFNVVRETYAGFKSTLYDDFHNRLKAFGLSSPFDTAKEVQSFRIMGNKINFLGCDKPSKFEGASADYWYYNEILDIQQRFFDLGEQRCRKFWFADFNPKFSQHWVFQKIINRDNVALCHSTFRDNPFISDIERAKVLSYEPTPENIRQGTADDYMWSVYGLGERKAPEGVIFKHVNWIDAFPENIPQYYYGLDFGYTNDPCAIVKYAETERDIFIQELCYQPLENALLIDQVLQKVIDDKDKLIACDGADPDMVKELFSMGWRTLAVKKPKGSIKHGISLLKRKRLNIVLSKNFKQEQENYCYREINGIKIDEPIDKFNHLWDASRYAAVSSAYARPITVG